MAQVNADTEVLGRIQSKLNNLWAVADKGYSSCSQALENAQQQMRDFYGRMNSQVSLLQAEADRLERTADAERQDYDRQVKEAEEGKSSFVPYYSPDMKREEARTKRQQAEKLKEALEEYCQKCKSFKDVQDRFISEFSKIASGGSGGGDKDQLEKTLEKSIDNLNDYERTHV